MKSNLLYIAAFLLLLSCSTDDGNGPCGIPDGVLIDPISQSIYIELVDSDGTNLITNETYNGLDITAEKNDIVIRPVVFDQSQILDLPESVRDIIVLQLFGEEGDNTWSIHLNENETDTLVVDIKNGPPDECGFFLLEVISVTYNSVEQNIQPFAVFDLDPKINYKITVVK